MSVATAGKYVNQLQAQGVLREITGQARNCIFLTEAIFQAIDDPCPRRKLREQFTRVRIGNWNYCVASRKPAEFVPSEAAGCGWKAKSAAKNPG